MRGVALGLIVACGCGSSSKVMPDGAPPPIDAPAVVLEDVHLYGRFTDDGRFAWPGSRIATQFSGTTISLDLEDTGGEDRFDVTVDATQTTVQVTPGRQTYVLADGLADGEHSIEIARRTESFFGTSTFHGLAGAPLVASPRANRLIEFVGDSMTCGYGILGVGPNCSFDASTEAETHAWGTLAAHELGAEHVAVAYSGIGMSRNIDDTADTMPDRYGRTLADDPTSAWPFAYTPDVVVIDLGTNDYTNGGDPGQAFHDTYVAFVQMVRTHFAQAYIVLATSPMISGADRTTLHAHLDAIAAAVADPRVVVADLPEQLAADGYGCDFHPSDATAHKMAGAIVAAIRPLTGW